MKEKIAENAQKIKQNKVLPYLVGNVVEILDVDAEGEESGAVKNEQNERKGKCAVIKTSSRQVGLSHPFSAFHRPPLLTRPLFIQTVFLPMIGLVPAEKLRPGDLIGVNKDSYLVLDTLPAEYDSRVKAMEVDEKPTDSYTDIGGLDKQIEELVEAIVLPMQQADKFKKLGIKPPKGALMYGPPGTGKTLLARACAAQTNACYLKLAGPSLVQVSQVLPLVVSSPFTKSKNGLILFTIALVIPSRCSSVMVRSLCEMRSSWQGRRRHQSSSLMRLMRLEPSGECRLGAPGYYRCGVMR